MPSAEESLMRILRANEYEDADREMQSLTEATNNLYKAIEKDEYNIDAPTRILNNRFKLTKEVICECMGNLYLESLVIDSPDEYSKSLKNAMREECEFLMSGAKSVHDLKEMFSNSSDYIKNILTLSEEICDSKSYDELSGTDASLTSDDKKLIEKFEETEGKTEYGEELQKRVVNVFNAERKMGEEHAKNVQNMIDSLADTDNSLSEAVEKGINMYSVEPQTLFNAIFINKSRSFLTENASGDVINDNKDLILAETICTYTLFECLHALGFHTYTPEERDSMRNKFFITMKK